MTEEVLKNWNQRCLESITKEKMEIARRYNIRFGQTEIYCARCERPVPNPTKHVCEDLRLRAFVGGRKEERDLLLKQKRETDALLVDHIRSIGRTKTAILLRLDVKTVSHWIDKKIIPKKYHSDILSL